MTKQEEKLVFARYFTLKTEFYCAQFITYLNYVSHMSFSNVFSGLKLHIYIYVYTYTHIYTYMCLYV